MRVRIHTQPSPPALLRPLELGSGSGLCGLLAGRLLGGALLTDRSVPVLHLLRRNVALQQEDGGANCLGSPR